MPRLSSLLTALILCFGAATWARAPDTNVDTLPAYVPQQQVSGTIRNAGSGFAGLLALWEAGFAIYHPAIHFVDDLRSGDAAIGAVEAGAADLAINGREPVLTEYLSFAEVFGNDGPFQVTVATGSYDKLGKTWAQVIYVNKDNPIAHLSMEQLDGIFGTDRTGGYEGYRWTTKLARAASQNIRTWGQLGLRGKWAKQPIHTYGYAPTGMSNFFEQKVFHGGTKWNPNYRQYVEASAKQATDRAGTTDQLIAELAHDPYGIAWAGVAHGKGNPNVKMIALRDKTNGPDIFPTLETVRNRSYPLTRSIFIQLNRPPGTAISPPLKEFLRYILSRDGQMVVRQNGNYLPLTHEEVERQRHALETEVEYHVIRPSL